MDAADFNLEMEPPTQEDHNVKDVDILDEDPSIPLINEVEAPVRMQGFVHTDTKPLTLVGDHDGGAPASLIGEHLYRQLPSPV